jgi:hypothetical protein
MAAPSSYFKWGTVTDTYFGVVADQDLDVTRTPDLVPVQGRVVFTPTLPNGAPLLFTSVPFVATPLAVTAVYNDQGQLTLNDVVGVRLIATDNPLETYTNWLWTATFTVAVGTVAVVRNSFSFRLPGDTTLDLATVQTVATVNGVPSTTGPKGDPGSGVKIRGVVTGSTPAVLPSGYGAGQDGYTYRVRSVDGSYDELWAWVWTGTAGSWVDVGPAVGAAVIDDTQPTPFTTYSSAKIEALIALSLAAGQGYTDQALAAYSPDDYQRVQNKADLSWPPRDAPGDRHVEWVGLDFPPVGGGYALPGMDSATLVDQLP